MHKLTFSQKKCVGKYKMEKDLKHIPSLVFITKETHVKSNHKVLSQMYC